MATNPITDTIKQKADTFRQKILTEFQITEKEKKEEYLQKQKEYENAMSVFSKYKSQVSDIESKMKYLSGDEKISYQKKHKNLSSFSSNSESDADIARDGFLRSIKTYRNAYMNTYLADKF